MLRYSTPNILGVWGYKPLQHLGTEVDAGGDMGHFANVVEDLLMSLPNKTADGDSRLKFATGEANVNASHKVYGLMQCTPDLMASDCLGCLYWGMYYVLRPDSWQTGLRVLQPSCSIRYELQKFYAGSPSSPATSGKGSVNPKIVVLVLASVLVAILFLLVIFLIWVFLRARESNKKMKKAITFKLLEMNHNFSSIKGATQNFSKDNQLGCGGFGRVYKGKLEGREIAVKRIIDTSSDVKDFENEVQIAAKVRHINLAGLLGVCIEGNERLLIFEYVSRGSLDQILFDPKHEMERALLDWEKRYDIILGIARGLLYLHKEYPHKILHRDLKAANVLLDEEWRPKITDFGTAKLFRDQNQTQANTVAVGTTAYMAPEYLKDSIASEKSDVYSFGVLVLEILAGRRTKIPNQEDLIPLARRKWDDETRLEIIDQNIKPTTDSGSLEMTRFIGIALSCLRENAKDRPEMSSVVQMLTRQSSNLDGSISSVFL